MFKKVLIMLVISLCFIQIISVHKQTLASDDVDYMISQYDYDGYFEYLAHRLTLLNRETQPNDYMMTLADMMLLELRYNTIDAMIHHAIELYEISVKNQNNTMQIYALYALAYYDYTNFYLDRMDEKLDKLLAIDEGPVNKGKMLLYNIGIALYTLDSLDYAKAITAYEDALIEIDLIQSSHFIKENTNLYTGIASAQYQLGNVEAAIATLEKGISLTNAKNVEVLTELYYTMAQFHLINGAFDLATEHVQTCLTYHHQTSKLFKAFFPERTVLILKASIAFQSKNYEEAASLYNLFFTQETNFDAIKNKIEAQSAAEQFESNEMENKINLLLTLESEQNKRLELQKRTLYFAYSALGLLLLLFMGILIFMRQLFKQKRLLYALSITDQLTQIYNRSYILNQFENLPHGPKCIAMVDIDRFKQINDVYGHVVGDVVLRKVAETLKNNLDSKGTVGRYGGEEFLVIVEPNHFADALETMELVRESIALLVWDYPGLVTTISVGLVFSTDHEGELLLTEADCMLYRAKNEGRNRVVFSKL